MLLYSNNVDCHLCLQVWSFHGISPIVLEFTSLANFSHFEVFVAIKSQALRTFISSRFFSLFASTSAKISSKLHFRSHSLHHLVRPNSFGSRLVGGVENLPVSFFFPLPTTLWLKAIIAFVLGALIIEPQAVVSGTNADT